MENKRILILCGGQFAFPTIQSLGIEKFLCGIGIGKGEKEIVNFIEEETQKNDSVAFKSFPDKKSLVHLLQWIEEVHPDYIFCISFPFLLSEEIRSYGEDRFINFHPAPLPEYRGVMPIFEVLRNQEKETAVSVHFMDNEFDRGPVILKERVALSGSETYGELTLKLSERTAMVALNIAHMLQFGSQVPRTIQDEDMAYYYDRPQLEETFIYWENMRANEILSLINACNPWNQGADAVLQGKKVKILSASLSEKHHGGLPGKILDLTEAGEIAVSCLDGRIINIQIIASESGIFTANVFMLKYFAANYSYN